MVGGIRDLEPDDSEESEEERMETAAERKQKASAKGSRVFSMFK